MLSVLPYGGIESIFYIETSGRAGAGMFVYGALSENLAREEFQLVMGDNFRRLLGM